MLSAGCAGRWYFDWIEQTYGAVDEHLGIEFYMPRPADLPANVIWIENTASDMTGVADASVDLVLSGQNIEHRWPEEVSGFMVEAARVVRPGGHLVIDSPNRLLTAPLNWSHPEHTVELTPSEAVRLFHLAGFDVTAVKGIWLCRDASRSRVLSFDPNTIDPEWSVTERLVAAYDRPDDAFLWWVEGVRSERTADPPALETFMATLFGQSWPERTQRLLVPAHRRVEDGPDGSWVKADGGDPGIVLFGPYMPLRAGKYRCTWEVLPCAGATSPYAAFDIIAGDGDQTLARREVHPGERLVSLEIELSRTTFGLQFRCESLGTSAFQLRRRILLDAFD